jgi:predicted anti-sigma-YlaC factor YlaD
MEHEEIVTLMMESLDGELQQDELVQLDAHLQSCPSCSQQWESIQAIHQLFLQAPVLSPAADFTQRTLARLPNPRHRLMALSAIYGLLLLSGLVPLILFIWLATQIRPAFNQPAFVDGLLQGGEQLLGLGQTILAAFWQSLSDLGELIGQDPAIIGLMLVMLGAIFLWGGVYSQLTRQQQVQ